MLILPSTGVQEIKKKKEQDDRQDETNSVEVNHTGKCEAHQELNKA